MTTTVPSGYLKCDGGTYNKSDYTDLFNLLYQLPSTTRSTWGSANWTTQFNTPKLQGEFLRGTGTSGYSLGGAGSAVGYHQAPTSFSHIYHGSGTDTNYPNVAGSGPINVDAWHGNSTSTGAYIQKDGTYNFGGTVYTMYTSRPTNTSVLFCIRYK